MCHVVTRPVLEYDRPSCRQYILCDIIYCATSIPDLSSSIPYDVVTRFVIRYTEPCHKQRVLINLIVLASDILCFVVTRPFVGHALPRILRTCHRIYLATSRTVGQPNKFYCSRIYCTSSLPDLSPGCPPAYLISGYTYLNGIRFGRDSSKFSGFN